MNPLDTGLTIDIGRTRTDTLPIVATPASFIGAPMLIGIVVLCIWIACSMMAVLVFEVTPILLAGVVLAHGGCVLIRQRCPHADTVVAALYATPRHATRAPERGVKWHLEP